MFSAKRPQGETNRERILEIRKLMKKEIMLRKNKHRVFDMADMITQYGVPSLCKYGDDCVQCLQHFMHTNLDDSPRNAQNCDAFAYDQEVSNATAQNIIADLVASMNEEHATLVDKLANFGDTLLDKWPRRVRRSLFSSEEAMLTSSRITVHE